MQPLINPFTTKIIMRPNHNLLRNGEDLKYTIKTSKKRMKRKTWITSNGYAKVVTVCGPNVLYLQKNKHIISQLNKRK